MPPVPLDIVITSCTFMIPVQAPEALVTLRLSPAVVNCRRCDELVYLAPAVPLISAVQVPIKELIVMTISTPVKVSVVTPPLKVEALIVAVVPTFRVPVAVLPSGPWHLKVMLVTWPIAFAPPDWSMTVPVTVTTVQVKEAPDVVSVMVNVVPLDAVPVKFGPPVTVQVPAAMAGGLAWHSAARSVPAAKIAPNRLRMVGRSSGHYLAGNRTNATGRPPQCFLPRASARARIMSKRWRLLSAS